MSIDDERLDHFLAATALCPSPSEAHGMLCGLISGGMADPESVWMSQLVPDAEAGDLLIAEGQRALEALARRTIAELEDDELALRLCLPDDDQPIQQRAAAASDWVRGFLYAWGMLGSTGPTPSEQIAEILRDFTELTRLDLDRLDEDEQHEEALTEVIEFIRIAVLLIYQERVLARAGGHQP